MTGRIASTGPSRSQSQQRAKLTPEDLVRADTYRLLAALLREPPTADLLRILSEVDAGPLCDPLAAAWDLLKQAAGGYNTDEIRLEFDKLFIGMGRGEVVPYASWYAEGLLMGRPLALLRQDLARLGLKRRTQVFESEDHAAALCETMALICSRSDISQEVQARFFQSHLSPWLLRFFQDLQNARSAAFYGAAARLGESFLRTERQYLIRKLPESITGGNRHETRLRQTSL